MKCIKQAKTSLGPTLPRCAFQFVDWESQSLLSLHQPAVPCQVFTDRAKKIIQETERNDKFFMWVAYHAAHDDLNADSAGIYGYSEEVEDNSTSRTRLAAKRVLADVDHAVGELIGALKDASLFNDTVLIMHSDNGGKPCGNHLSGNNWPYRGSKNTFFEGGVKLPAFIYAPGVLPEHSGGTEYPGLMHHVDLMAIIVEGLAGGKLHDSGSDSVNHWPAILKGETGLYKKRKHIVFNLEADNVAIRKEDMKLLAGQYNGSWYLPTHEFSEDLTEEDCNVGVILSLCNRPP